MGETPMLRKQFKPTALSPASAPAGPASGRTPAAPSAHAVDFHRVGFHHPVHDVDAVDVLFDDVIAGEPGVVEPVANLVFQVRPLRLARLVPEVSDVVVAVPRDDVADHALVNLLDRV